MVEGKASTAPPLYLYGIIPQGQALPDNVAAPLLPVLCSRLVAVCELVTSEDFAPGPLEEKLQSVEWVAQLALRHEAVLEAAMAHGPVIPARLCTLFSSTDALSASLAENERRYLAVLARLGDRREWGLKVLCDGKKLQAVVAAGDPTLRGLEQAMAAASPGGAYVLGKRAASRRAEVAAQRVSDATEEILTAVEKLPLEARLRPLPASRAVGGADAIINLAVLADTAALALFRAAVDSLSRSVLLDGFVFEVTGPWPPYSFCGEESTAEAGRDSAAAVELAQRAR